LAIENLKGNLILALFFFSLFGYLYPVKIRPGLPSESQRGWKKINKFVNYLLKNGS
jgi:hypothetical protein